MTNAELLKELKAQLHDCRTRRGELREQLTQAHARIVKLESEGNAYQDGYRKRCIDAEKLTTQAEYQRNVAEKRLVELESRLATFEGDLLKLNRAEERIAQLEQALELARHNFIRANATNLDELKTMPTPYDAALTPAQKEGQS